MQPTPSNPKPCIEWKQKKQQNGRKSQRGLGRVGNFSFSLITQRRPPANPLRCAECYSKSNYFEMNMNKASKCHSTIASVQIGNQAVRSSGAWEPSQPASQPTSRLSSQAIDLEAKRLTRQHVAAHAEGCCIKGAYACHPSAAVTTAAACNFYYLQQKEEFLSPLHSSRRLGRRAVCAALWLLHQLAWHI